MDRDTELQAMGFIDGAAILLFGIVYLDSIWRLGNEVVHRGYTQDPCGMLAKIL